MFTSAPVTYTEEHTGTLAEMFLSSDLATASAFRRWEVSASSLVRVRVRDSATLSHVSGVSARLLRQLAVYGKLKYRHS